MSARLGSCAHFRFHKMNRNGIVADAGDSVQRHYGAWMVVLVLVLYL
jgi:hypothetical protein